MPAIRSVRRSRRLSKQPPADASESGWEVYDLDQIHNAAGSSGDAQLAENIIDDDDDLESFVTQRPSHSRKKSDGHIPRPPNAFLIFRSEVWYKMKNDSRYTERDHRQISRIAGDYWRALPDDEREEYRAMAAIAKEEHKKKYPHYKFCPVAKGKGGKRRCNEDVQARNLRSKAVARQLLLSRKMESQTAKADSDPVDHDGSERSSANDELDMSYNIRGGLPAQKKGKKSSKGKARATTQRRCETPEPASPPTSLYRIEPFSPGLSTLPALSSPSSQSSSPPSSPELRERSPYLEAEPSGTAASQLLLHYQYPTSGDDTTAGHEPTLSLDELYPLSKDSSSSFNFSPIVGSSTLDGADGHIGTSDGLYGSDDSYEPLSWLYNIPMDGGFLGY